MLTRLVVRNFKLFEEIDIELGQQVVFIGPNNSGKTSALQALALWDEGRMKWLSARGHGEVPSRTRGVTINRQSVPALPVSNSKMLWRNLLLRQGREGNHKNGHILIDVEVEGINVSADENRWACGWEFDYTNPEFFYCRPLRREDGTRMAVPEAVSNVQMAYLPPMSGLTANEVRLDQGAVNVRIGEGRTAEVLRNLCYKITESPNGEDSWELLCERVEKLFGNKLDRPHYIADRGELEMTYRTPDGIQLDLTASGRGELQTILLLAHMTLNHGSVLLLDEPDAHLEVLRQRQIYQVLNDVAEETSSQIIAASHSEVLLNEAVDRDVLIAFVGKPHRIEERGSQVAKSLKSIGFEHYIQAMQKGWVLYLEGSTDLATLLSLARKLDHPAAELLEAPFVHYVADQPNLALSHFYGVREAKPDLTGIAILDRPPPGKELPSDPNLNLMAWRKREIENYICHRELLLKFAAAESTRVYGEGNLFSNPWREAMEERISELEKAREVSRLEPPWDADVKVSDDFLDAVFANFYERIGLPNRMLKTNYHRLAEFLEPAEIDPEISEKLEAIVRTANKATPG